MREVHIYRPVKAVQGYSPSGRKQLPYVSIWLSQETHVQVHGLDRGVAAQLIEKLLNKKG